MGLGLKYIRIFSEYTFLPEFTLNYDVVVSPLAYHFSSKLKSSETFCK